MTTKCQKWEAVLHRLEKGNTLNATVVLKTAEHIYFRVFFKVMRTLWSKYLSLTTLYSTLILLKKLCRDLLSCFCDRKFLAKAW